MRGSRLQSGALLALALAGAACAARSGAGGAEDRVAGHAEQNVATAAAASAATAPGATGSEAAGSAAIEPAMPEREKYEVHATAALQIHLEPQVGFVPPVPDVEALTCDSLVVRSPFTGALAVHVLVSGLARPTAAQFGIEYSPTMNVTHWTTARGGVEIPGEGWPASGSWVALAYGSTLGVDRSLAYLGTLSLAPGSTGTLRFIGVSEDEDLVKVVDARQTEWIVDPSRLASAAIRAEGGFRAPCP